MLELAHALTGGVIAYEIGNPALSLPLAFASHFVVDLLPHWNPHLSTEKKRLGFISHKTTFFILIDCLIGLTLGLFLAFKALPDARRMFLVIAGCFFGILPDLIEAPFFFLNQKGKLMKKIVNFQGKIQYNAPFWPGMLFQALYVSALLYLVR